jgi:hypothetical protein
VLRFCSQHFIFFVSYEWAQEESVLYYTKLERVARDKHSSLLGQFVSCEEKSAQILFTTLHFLRNLEIGPISKRVILHSQERFASEKHSSLLGQFVSCEENEVLWTGSVHFFVTKQFECRVQICKNLNWANFNFLKSIS